MCGIAGLLRYGGGDDTALAGIAARMADTLGHRGPDASGSWAQGAASGWARGAAGIGFGHRRLSILDLSAAGAQPMRTACGRLTVTFNGEIYNHLDLRAELEAAGAAPNWAGHSDTETLLYAVLHWGVSGALERFNGMFAFALWDEVERALTLARDRFGEKPLFYGFSGRDLVFGSELKALAAHPDWAPSLDRAALTAFTRYAYVPAPASIWREVRKLPPGSSVTFGPTFDGTQLPAPIAWWSHREVVVAAQADPVRDATEAADELERRLRIAVQRQCISDVPLGAFLSGGIDSSTIVALMQGQGGRPVRTFTIGFAEGAFNEADDARKVAQYLATDHTELTIDPRTALDVIPDLPRMYDEPFGDSSQIPTHLVAALARRHVTVALSGDAGDELFGGYNRHVWGGVLAARLGPLPQPVKRALAGLLSAVSPQPLDGLARLAAPVLPVRFNVRRAGDQAGKLARLIGAESFDAMYRMLCSIDDTPAAVVLAADEQPSWADREIAMIAPGLAALEHMTLADALSYLTDDILQKVDRAAMAVSLETRIPFLDRDVVAFAARVPSAMKVRDGRGKWLVRQVLYRHVPPALVDRPKTGFSIPLDDWLRGPLKAWAGDLLSPDRLRRQGLFAPEPVARAFADHIGGRRSRGYWLWNVLMAQAWFDTWATT